MIVILATICLGLSCHDVVVTSSEQDPTISMASCKIGQPQLAAWLMQNWPGYDLAGWRCVRGERRHET